MRMAQPRVRHLENWSDWASVLSAMNSHARHVGLDHAVDGVHAAAADADHAQLGLAPTGRARLRPTR